MSTWRRRAALDAWIVRTEELLRTLNGGAELHDAPRPQEAPEPVTRRDDAA